MEENSTSPQISVSFISEDNEELGASGVLVPVDISTESLQILCNQLLENSDDPVPISFFTDDGIEIVDSVRKSLDVIDFEKTLKLVYQPQAVFRVRPVTRCSSSIPGHGEPIISAQFSPDGRGLASGSGDSTMRIWDIELELPLHTCKAHKNWVLCISWSPDATKIASACKNGEIIIWNSQTGEQIGKTLKRHKQWVTSLAWQPLHKDPNCRFLASSGKDSNIFIWDTVNGSVVRCLGGHTASVTCLRWGGEGLLYSGSQDRTVKMWRSEDGVLCRTMTGHAHWVNTLALNTDYVLRTSCFEPSKRCIKPSSVEERQTVAKTRYDAALKIASGERLVSGSDDFTLFFWNPKESKQAVVRMTGHMQLVNQVVFSPDTRYVASASFDKSIKLWCGRSGKYIATFRGHVGPVYQVAWSADSRLLVSGSADSTLKVFELKTRSLYYDLPGHGDAVFTVDWSPEGTKVVSGGKDKVLKIWRQ
uniref:WD_REPEATS_REGION domain-containing protein n=1 Tax=Caenorhabditis japonica TaxID=281687 RepID=A0A8R1HZN2_CAEJA